jgi:hypothetical protein
MSEEMNRKNEHIQITYELNLCILERTASMNLII